MPKKNDLTGMRFGKLIAIRAAEKKNGHYVWECVCDCGNVTCVIGSKLTNEHTKSCGCIRKDGTKKPAYSHGKSRSRLYRIWSNIKTRCKNENAENYKYYGGKGIAICEEWSKSFQAFYDWSITNGYKDDLTIDRKDSDCNYCPENCQWITQSENATRANVKRWADSSGIEVRSCAK